MNQPQPSNPLIRKTMQNFVDCGSIAGAIFLAADGERVRSLDCAGYADLASRRPMTPDAVFWVASMTKPLTAVCLMMLVEEGKVQLDNAVENYLPEFKGQLLRADTGELRPPHRPPTVRQILSHTAGLPFSSAAEVPTLDTLPLSESVASYAREPLFYEPGTRYLYSNEGTNTAGRIIETLSGQSYWEFLKSRLLDPLTMTDTTFWPDAAQLARLATAYKTENDRRLSATTVSQLRYPLNDPSRHPFPAGGAFSTLADYTSFGQMLLNGGTHRGQRIISAASIAEMSKRQTPATVSDLYGFCLGLGADGSFGHGGAFATQLNVHPASGLVTVWLIQNAGSLGGDPMNNLNATLTAIAKQ